MRCQRCQTTGTVSYHEFEHKVGEKEAYEPIMAKVSITTEEPLFCKGCLVTLAGIVAVGESQKTLSADAERRRQRLFRGPQYPGE